MCTKIAQLAKSDSSSVIEWVTKYIEQKALQVH